MKGLIAALLLAAGAAEAQEADIRAVIDGQIAAFRADDFETAFTYASPGIKEMFGSPENFGTMVRQGYPMVWKPGAVEYLGHDEGAAAWAQEVLITDDAGRLHKLEYRMVETPEGWKIGGVRILTAPEVGA